MVCRLQQLDAERLEYLAEVVVHCCWVTLRLLHLLLVTVWADVVGDFVMEPLSQHHYLGQQNEQQPDLA